MDQSFATGPCGVMRAGVEADYRKGANHDVSPFSQRTMRVGLEPTKASLLAVRSPERSSEHDEGRLHT